MNFARENNLRLVVKGGGHSYKGTSCSADSLLIWTRRINNITLHDTFVPQGCEAKLPPQPAASIGAGAIWAQAYDAVTTKGGRYVQGGGCTTVGVAGLIQRRVLTRPHLALVQPRDDPGARARSRPQRRL